MIFESAIFMQIFFKIIVLCGLIVIYDRYVVLS